MIIIYHKDERTSIPHAGLLVQKGFDNVFLLSGGIDDFVKIYPEKCEGPGVEALVNAKIKEDILKKDGTYLYNFIELLKKAKKLQKTGSVKLSSTFNDNMSSKNSVTTAKASVMSVTSKNTISNLKNDLKK
jgi:hypothetical protein